MQDKTICVVGGSGFVGRYVVSALVTHGFRVKVMARHSVDIKALSFSGDADQVVFVQGDVTNFEAVTRHVAGAHAVINLTGILFEKGRQTFDAIHRDASERLAKAAKEAGVPIFVQMSALGVDRATDSRYAATKLQGEQAVRDVMPDVVIIRPSVVFGAEDNFFNQFARMAQYSPFLPLIGGGHTRFQPVYVGDVAEVIAQCVMRPKDAAGQCFELGGPDVMTFRELLEYLLRVTALRARFMSIPFGVASVQAWFAEWLPTPLLTRDQVRLLRYDNVLCGAWPGMEVLGVKATPVDEVVPGYLQRYKKRLKF